MKKTALSGVLLLAALSVAAAGARVKAQPSGDSCTATGSGSLYTLHISLPPGAQQFGRAFGARGASIENAVIPGANGNFTTQGAAANTTVVWLSDAPLATSNVVTLTTTGPASSLTVVPASSSQPEYFSPITCRFASASGPKGASFDIGRQGAFTVAAGAWPLPVTIPEAGTVSARQLEPTVGTGAAAAVTPKPLIQVRRAALKTGGKVTLMLRPTSKGTAVLRTGKPLHVTLHVTFDPADGGSASKSVTLTLRK